MSRDFKKKMFKISVSTFSRFVEQPREVVLNELLKYWDKWDIYAVNIMFLKTLYEMLFHRDTVTDERDVDTQDTQDTQDSETVSLNEHRQNILDPNYSEKNTHFHSIYMDCNSIIYDAFNLIEKNEGF